MGCDDRTKETSRGKSEHEGQKSRNITNQTKIRNRTICHGILMAHHYMSCDVTTFYLFHFSPTKSFSTPVKG